MPFSIQRYEAVMTLLLIVLGTLVAVVATGFVVETLRQRPEAPDKLYWATNLPIQYTQIDGNRIRYIKTGSGPNLVLLHTLRTQLERLREDRAHAGEILHRLRAGLPRPRFFRYSENGLRPDLFIKAVEGFLDKLDLKDVTLAGISIGGVIPLIIAAKQNPRVQKSSPSIPTITATAQGSPAPVRLRG
jgi:hypothetical protein